MVRMLNNNATIIEFIYLIDTLVFCFAHAYTLMLQHEWISVRLTCEPCYSYMQHQTTMNVVQSRNLHYQILRNQKWVKATIKRKVQVMVILHPAISKWIWRQKLTINKVRHNLPYIQMLARLHKNLEHMFTDFLIFLYMYLELYSIKPFLCSYNCTFCSSTTEY